jgi:hypothetical protein
LPVATLGHGCLVESGLHSKHTMHSYVALVLGVLSVVTPVVVAGASLVARADDIRVPIPSSCCSCGCDLCTARHVRSMLHASLLSVQLHPMHAIGALSSSGVTISAAPPDGVRLA